MEIKILYIAGMGHSGSTLLDILLNNHPKIFSVGDFLFFKEWIRKNYLCSCKIKSRNALFGVKLLEIKK